jgi:ABC-type branched-subunit amino acid transport system substrate-binding protein
MAEQSPHRQARRSILAFAAAGMLAFALAGCHLVPKPRPERPPEPTRPEPQPVEPERPVPNLPPDETRNRVAVLVPLSGPNAGVGTSIANAANLALLDSGGDRIRIAVYDTAKGGAAAAANEAVADGSGLFLGPLLAEDVRAVAPVARGAGVPLIAFSNDVSVAGDGVYVMGFSPGQSVERVVEFARGRGAERFAALVPDTIYGTRASQAMVQAVLHAGGRLVGTQSYGRGTPALRTAIAALGAAGGYDALLIADGGRIAATAAPLIRAGPSATAHILGTELWATESDLGRTPGLRGAWYASVADGMFNQLRSRYRARYGTNPYRLASLGYDAVLLAVRIGRDWRIGRAFPEGALRDAGGFAGVDGAFRFGRNGVAERSLEVLEVTAAGTSVVAAAPRGFD